MSDGAVEQIKKFVFYSRNRLNGESKNEKVEILIPELLQASYSFLTWPSASVLAWFLWDYRSELKEKRILELGSGTSLPGILAAKLGARVILSESAILPRSLKHIQRCVEINNLSSDKDIKIVGLTWGLFLQDIFKIGPLDLIISSDCFYEPSVFEDILVTVNFLLTNNPSAKFICTYQERSSDWSIEHLLTKWDLKCVVIDIKTIGVSSGLNIQEVIGDHTIHLFEISKIDQ